jgi:hypothetical protein
VNERVERKKLHGFLLVVNALLKHLFPMLLKRMLRKTKADAKSLERQIDLVV